MEPAAGSEEVSGIGLIPIPYVNGTDTLKETLKQLRGSTGKMVVLPRMFWEVMDHWVIYMPLYTLFIFPLLLQYVLII